jgi:hypothetical protein
VASTSHIQAADRQVGETEPFWEEVVMSSRLVHAVLLVVLVLVLALDGATSMAQEATPAPGVEVGEVTVLGPDESYAGVSRGEWDARWWQWAVSLPDWANPNATPISARCGFGQSGPVFFLPTSSMRCVVPEGTAIYVYVGGANCSTVEPPPFFGRDEEELRACAAAWTDTVTDLRVHINNQEVSNPQAYRTTSPLYPVLFPEDNIIGVPPGVALVVSDSYSIIIAPPPPGEYVIIVSGVYVADDERLHLGTATRVIVEAPQVIEPEATPALGGTPAATPAA